MNIAFCETESQWQSSWELHLKGQNDGVCWLRKFDSVPQLKSDRRPWEIEQKNKWINPTLTELTTELKSLDVYSNVSHSGPFIALAVTTKGRIGVDIETQEEDWDKARCLKVGSRYFSPQESKSINNLADKKAVTAFFKLWTLKEATCKSMGEGIKNNLHAVEFEPSSTDSWKLVNIPWPNLDINNFKLSVLIKDNVYVAVTLCIKTK
ncbi:MAG: 4'-phosphopantetheinyl transferase superfamily protein [Bdellovibrionota bacterium]